MFRLGRQNVFGQTKHESVRKRLADEILVNYKSRFRLISLALPRASVRVRLFDFTREIRLNANNAEFVETREGEFANNLELGAVLLNVGYYHKENKLVLDGPHR